MSVIQNIKNLQNWSTFRIQHREAEDLEIDAILIPKDVAGHILSVWVKYHASEHFYEVCCVDHATHESKKYSHLSSEQLIDTIKNFLK